MQLTMSQDGRMRATVRVEHRISYEDLFAWAAYRIVTYDEIPPRGRKAAEEALRDALRSHGGERFYCWIDDIEPEDREQIEQRAHQWVGKVFPEFPVWDKD